MEALKLFLQSASNNRSNELFQYENLYENSYNNGKHQDLWRTDWMCFQHMTMVFIIILELFDWAYCPNHPHGNGIKLHPANRPPILQSLPAIRLFVLNTQWNFFFKNTQSSAKKSKRKTWYWHYIIYENKEKDQYKHRTLWDHHA